MKKIDLSDFYRETETSDARAYSHALDVEFIVNREMLRQNLTKRELASRMGISAPALSKLLNSPPNMTLKTIANFELALGIEIAPRVVSGHINECHYSVSPVSNDNPWGSYSQTDSFRRTDYSLVEGGLAA